MEAYIYHNFLLEYGEAFYKHILYVGIYFAPNLD